MSNDTSLTDAISVLLSTAEAHANALRVFGAVTGRDVLTSAANVERDAKMWANSAAAAAVEAARPKGPTVRILVESRYGSAKSEIPAELIRTTAKQAILKIGHSSEEGYKIEGGRRVKRAASFSDTWRIHPDDLATCRALKPGHNAVSKALSGITAKVSA